MARGDHATSAQVLVREGAAMTDDDVESVAKVVLGVLVAVLLVFRHREPEPFFGLPWYVKLVGPVRLSVWGLPGTVQWWVRGRTYHVFDHPVWGHEAVKAGFSWPAFFVSWVWLLWRRLWWQKH